MLSFLGHARVFLAAGATDLRKSFDTLAGVVRNCLDLETRSGLLFVFANILGHRGAGSRIEVIDSLLVTARRGGLDRARWLEDVLRRIPMATTENLHELLPGNWKPATAWLRRCGICAHEPAIVS